MLQLLWLIPLGYFVGTFGTLIGAGGGFILVPILLLLYPEKSPETITSISLTVVFFNAISGSYAYGKMKRIDYKSGLIFSIATIPGSILGAFITSSIPRKSFDIAFGIMILLLSVYLFIKKEKLGSDGSKIPKYSLTRKIVDADAKEYEYSFNPILGVVISIFVGFISSFFGIGGGIIHVPALIHLLNFPVHLATATSQFILSISSFTGALIHGLRGELMQGATQIAMLSIGVILGARMGAKLSSKLRGLFIVRALAFALGLVGVRILLKALF